MTTQLTSIGQEEKQTTSRANWLGQAGLIIAFLLIGFVVVFMDSNLFKIFPTNQNLTFNVILSSALLIVAIWFKFEKRLNRFWQVIYAFFLVSIVYLITWLLIDVRDNLFAQFNLPINSTMGLAIDKIWSTLFLGVVPLIVLTKIAKFDLGSIFIKRGNLKMGLGFGSLVFFNLLASVFLFFATRFTSLGSLGSAVVWGLVFSLSNGFFEELWLRGIFFKRTIPLFGVGWSLVLTSFLFAIMHTGTTMMTPIAIPFYFINTLTLGLGCGYLMIKSDSIWGPALIHAGADFFLFVAMMATP